MYSRHGRRSLERAMIVKPKQRVMPPKTTLAFNHKNGHTRINDWNIPSKIGNQKLASKACNLKGICVMCSIWSTPIPCMDDIAMVRCMRNKPA